MTFGSINFLPFLFFVVTIYYLIPKKLQGVWLLLSSYWFYLGWNRICFVVLIFVTLSSYSVGLLIDNAKNNKFRVFYTFFGIIGLLLVLFFFKYIKQIVLMLIPMIASIYRQIDPSEIETLFLPAGLSFYTFEAISYIVDVFRNDTKAEKNLIRYALFISFFPKLIEGPIEKPEDFISQAKKEKTIEYEKIRDGVYLLCWGFFLKLVLADRIAIFVNTIYGDYSGYSGSLIFVATILYAVQIYCDFAGYSTIAVGTAKMLGYDLTDNFNVPYYSKSIAEFWRRWHVSLSNWFKSYIYFPLGGNRKGILRKYLNLMIVFFISGLWHGSGLTFIIWGVVNGLYQVFGETLKPVRLRIKRLLKINDKSVAYQVFQTIAVFLLVDFTWLFFRANSINDAINIIKIIVLNTGTKDVISSLFQCGLDKYNFLLMMICIAFMFFMDYFKYKGVCVREKLKKQNVVLRSILLALAICFIVIFGVWGPGYDAAGFVYLQF